MYGSLAVSGDSRETVLGDIARPGSERDPAGMLGKSTSRAGRAWGEATSTRPAYGGARDGRGEGRKEGDEEARFADDGRRSEGFTQEERAAMRERAQELKRSRGRAGKSDGASEVLAKIAEMPQPDRRMAKRLHAILTAAAPDLAPRTWYGMPAYAKDGKVVCFFQSGAKFKSRYATLGFSDSASLDDGAMWPTAFALTSLNDAEEAAIIALVKKAVG